MVDIEVLALVLGASRLLMGLWHIITLPCDIVLFSWLTREHPNLVALIVLGCSIHLASLHSRFHFLVHLVLPHLFLLAKRAALGLVQVWLLIAHHASLILPVLNHDLRALLLALEVYTLYLLRWAYSWLLLLPIVKAVGLTLLIRWPLVWLIAPIILVMITSRVLVEHLRSTVH